MSYTVCQTRSKVRFMPAKQTNKKPILCVILITAWTLLSVPLLLPPLLLLSFLLFLCPLFFLFKVVTQLCWERETKMNKLRMPFFSFQLNSWICVANNKHALFQVESAFKLFFSRIYLQRKVHWETNFFLEVYHI